MPNNLKPIYFIILVSSVTLMVLACGVSISSRSNLPNLEQGVSLIEGNASSPSWSPDGRYLVFEYYPDDSTPAMAETESDICKFDRQNNETVQLSQKPGRDRFPIWSPDGTHIAYLRRQGIYLVSPDGNNDRRIVDHFLPQDEDLVEAGSPQWSSDGQHLVFSARVKSNTYSIHMIDVQTGVLTTLTNDNGRNDTSPRWTNHDSQIVFLSTVSEDKFPNQVRIISIDGNNEEIVVEGLQLAPQLAASTNGQIAFSTVVGSDAPEHLSIMDLMSQQRAEVSTSGNSYVAWSPDSNILAFSRIDEVLLFDRHENKFHQVPIPTLGTGFIYANPRWSTDGRYIGFSVSKLEQDKVKKLLYIYDLKEAVW